MLEAVLYFILGFLAAALIALMISPAVWNRAVVLTRKRIEASVPLTLNEIQADKDQLRAEFAMSTRRLEMSIEELREKASRQVIDINRKRDDLARLSEESRERIRTIGELEARTADLRAQLREREEQLAMTTQRLDDTRAKLEARALELEGMRIKLIEAQTESDSRRVEVAAKQTMLDSMSTQVGDIDQRDRNLRVENAAMKEQLGRAVADLERERRRNADLAAKISRLGGQVSEHEETLLRRERDLARTRETSGVDEAEASRTAAELVQEKARNVELQAKLAQSALQMEALLNDASNDNVEKAMASMNKDLKRLEDELAAISAERDSLREQLSGQTREHSKDWEIERRENAILRERINDLAAQVTAMTAAMEGKESPIHAILAAAPKLETPATGVNAPQKPATLAERIRALQGSARQNKTG